MADVQRYTQRWLDAGVIDTETAGRIQAFEAAHQGAQSWGWTVRIVVGFGGILLAAGVLLFVAAHWDTLSPTERFSLLVGGVGALHALGAIASPRVPTLSMVLHAVGTVAFGASVYLAGQIFNMDAHWPAGVMLWAVGAAVGFALLRDGLQLTLLALLVPAWLSSEWQVATRWNGFAAEPVWAAGFLLLALTYLTAGLGQPADRARRALRRIGVTALLPAALAFAVMAGVRYSITPLSDVTRAIGWFGAFGLPLILALVLHGRRAWPLAVAAAWIAARLWLFDDGIDVRIVTYGWWAVTAAALAGWGVNSRRPDLINLAFVIFGATVTTFYFAGMADMLGRSMGLIGLGVLLLAGGFALERGRRHLIGSLKGDPA
jgi:hypothetical protein